MKVFCVLLFGVAAVIAAPKIYPNVELRKNLKKENILTIIQFKASSFALELK